MTQRQTFLVENYFLVMGQRQELWANAYHKMSRFWLQLMFITQEYDVFSQVFLDAELIASIKIEIGAREATSEAATLAS